MSAVRSKRTFRSHLTFALNFLLPYLLRHFRLHHSVEIRLLEFSDLTGKEERVYVGSVLHVLYVLNVLCVWCIFYPRGTMMPFPEKPEPDHDPLSPNTVRRIEDAAAALIAACTPNPTNEQVRQHLGGGSLSHISPVMRAFRARRREQAAEQAMPLPPELAQLLTGQLGLLWQTAVRQGEAGALAAREQADADTEQADRERDEALAKVVTLESELAVLREVQAERDRLLQEVREQVARLTATGEHQAEQLQDMKASREDGRQLQAELLMLARQEIKGKMATE